MGYGDTEAIRGLAQRVLRVAEELRSEADAVLRWATGVHWTGSSADALHHAVHASAVALRAAAGLCGEAAAALLAHADEVERRKELIAAAERSFLHLASSAWDAVRSAAAPPSGHRDWLGFATPLGLVA